MTQAYANKDYLIAQLIEAAQEIMDDYPNTVAMPDEGSTTELNLIMTLRNFFSTLIDNLNESARNRYDHPQS